MTLDVGKGVPRGTVVLNCRADPGKIEVYIGRPTMGAELARLGIDRVMVAGPLGFGAFGNPINVYKPCPACGSKHTKKDRAALLGCYALALLTRILTVPRFVEALPHLQGRELGCWCAPAPCHGHVLAAVIDHGLAHDVQERAAIAEYEGGLARPDAEALAVREIAARLPGLLPW